MSRIIYVPQYPTPMRYQQWWWWKLPAEFQKAGFTVKVLGAESSTELRNSKPEMFSPIQLAIEMETKQINEYMELDLKHDDILFMSDISFPGLFGNVLFHKKPCKSFGYCHATSKNELDYFAPHRNEKFSAETATANALDKVFIGSHYHFYKLCWSNTEVVRLPYPPLKTFKEKKEHLIVSASRPTPQKVDIDLECKLEEKWNYPITRQQHNNWEDYYKFLSKSRILLITSFEDTFGYQIVDAVLNGCIPLAPNRCAYPEILPPEYIYEDELDLMRKVDYIINSDDEVPVPKLLCHEEMENFYSNIIKIMKGM